MISLVSLSSRCAHVLLGKKRHIGISGLWTQVLDAGLWTLDSGGWILDAGGFTLDAELCTLDTVVDWFRTESEPRIWFCLIKLLKIVWVQISKDSWSIFSKFYINVKCYVKKNTKRNFIARNRITLKAAILDC